MNCNTRPVRVAVVAPIMIQRDAISMEVRDTIRGLALNQGFDTHHLGMCCEFSDIKHRHCQSSADILRDPFYNSSDIAIYHFGIYSGIFDTLVAGGPRKKVIRFHNVTPPHLVSPSDQAILERSLRQIDCFRLVDEIWATSSTNAEFLLARGFYPEMIRIIPLIVDDPKHLKLTSKRRVPISVLYIGRIAPAKGIHDLIEAVARSPGARDILRVTIAGNMQWSDPNYVLHLKSLILKHRLEDIVIFSGTIDDTEKDRLFHSAHILIMPSYHEGFCRPVVEGFRAGCIPLAYDAYNLPNIVNRLGCIVPTGDIDALGSKLMDLSRSISRGLLSPYDPVLPLDRGYTSVYEFDQLAKLWADEFTFERISAKMRERVHQLSGV